MADFEPQYTEIINEPKGGGIGRTVLGGIGTAGLGAAKLVGSAANSAAIGVGNVAIGASRLFGGAAVGTAKAVGRSVWNSLDYTDGIRNPIVATGKNIGRASKFLGDHFVDYEKGKTVYNKATGEFETKGPNMNLTKLGKGVAFGLPAIASLGEAYRSYINSRVGSIDTKKVTATPDYNPVQYQVEHPDFAGATGDLVFALHRNR